MATNEIIVLKENASGGFDLTRAIADGTATKFLNANLQFVTPSASITGFTASLNTASPNNTINASMLIASGGTTDQDLVLSAKGNGAIIGQLPDGTATGGNKRGANAVDLLLSRTSASHVASGTKSFLAGGRNNLASADYSATIGGDTNSANGSQSFIGGGYGNTTNGFYSSVIAGDMNTAGSQGSVILGGSSNSTSSINTSILSSVNAKAYLVAQSIIGTYNTNSTKVRQRSFITMSIDKSTSGTVEMFIDGSSARLVMKNNSMWHVIVKSIAFKSDFTRYEVQHKQFVVTRGATASTITVASYASITPNITVGSTPPAINVTADTTNGSLKVEFASAGTFAQIGIISLEIQEIEV